ncbi:M9 family metallopeptidase [Chitinimonas sp. JJ19]|uniref:M9 family metallopeptidase n=1 Tax=Chitinimonas sp. JJ19 TaxID=3109352 RepID=UPI00300241A2
MKTKLRCPLLAALLLGCLSPLAQADTDTTERMLPMPQVRQNLPPSTEQKLYNLSETRRARTDLRLPKQRDTRFNGQVSALATTPECEDMNRLASHSGNDLANYLVSLPDYECHYGLFSLNSTLASQIYSPANMTAVASRFAQEAAAYNASNRNLINLIIYLRAGYYLAGSNTIPEPSSSLLGTLRPAIKQLLASPLLFQNNAVASPTAGETMKLITNLHDEAYYLSDMQSLVTRYTNTASNPNAAQALLVRSASDGYTGVLTVYYYANFRPEGLAILRSDASHATALNQFVLANKATLLNTNYSYQLTDSANEAFRMFGLPELKPTIKPMIKHMLATTSMTGPDMGLWLKAAQAVKYYDNANCAEYGTCNFEQQLANAALPISHNCSATIRIRAQDMTAAQLQESCTTLQSGETYFHNMLQTNRTPVANDHNTALEVVVFDDYANYSKYASAIYDIDTNNGGMYLEGNPAVVGNQARFIAHEASWMRPSFKIWNLEHEYVHYLDGRFNMYGDFGAGTAKPTVWWIEGIGEYLSLRNNNQASIDAARTGQYKLSQIFGNTYSMGDYTNRAYRWGYMATRFMMERHRSDVDTVLARFRAGDYNGYQSYMSQIGTRYDSEFASWAQTATTAGEPPMPGGIILPSCNHPYYLGKGCSISGFASSTRSYAYIHLPAGARNLKIWTTAGNGDVDLYAGFNRYPTTGSYDAASIHPGNNESISLPNPPTGQWIYFLMQAKQPFSGVAINASYD